MAQAGPEGEGPDIRLKEDEEGELKSKGDLEEKEVGVAVGGAALISDEVGGDTPNRRRLVSKLSQLQVHIASGQESTCGPVATGGVGECLGQVMEVELSSEESEALFSLAEEMERILDPENTLSTPPPSIDLSPLECHALQQEELEALRAIYDQDLTPLNDDCTCFAVDIKFLSDEIRDEDVIKIWFSLPPNYPCVPPVFEIEANRSGSFTYRDADELFDLLMAESINRIGGMMVFDLVTFAQEYMPDLVQRKKDEAVKQAAMDLDRKRTMELEDALRENVKSRSVPSELWSDLTSEGAEKQTKEKEEEGVSDEWEAMERKYGYQSQGVYKPVHFVGPISDVIKKLPEGLQITRIENILRQDLANRFDHCRRSAIKSLWQKERKMPQMFNLKPQIAFHGTHRTNLPSIVHRGLVVPGAGNDVRVCHGSSLGVGIYLSPSAEVSLSYSDTNRLIVCAALLGRMYKGSYDGGHHSSYNCFMLDYEWVFFNAAQVLPCYVIQVQDHPTKRKGGASNPPPLATLQEDSLHLEQDGDVTEKERKAKLLARANKFLPYGFGPGRKTVIEDAASFDDDEEDYGDYQLLRYATEDDVYDGKQVVKESTELQKYRFKGQTERTQSIEHKS